MEWVLRKPAKTYKNDDTMIDKLAKIHGIANVTEFLNPSMKSLYSPFHFNNMDKVIGKILNAIDTGKKISIFSDPDADGICSTSILFRYLRNYTENVQYFYAQRSQGHGISNGLEIIPEGTELLIIVDSSSSEADACKKIQEMGIDTIILDHHPVENENPYALIVNPQLDTYPNKEISGAGVVWKTCLAIDETIGNEFAFPLIDLAGVGVLADVMSMREPENRAILHFALENMTNYGLLAILRANKRPVKDLRATDISFTIAPNLNGCSRMNKIELALQLLTSDGLKECRELARAIKDLNDERKSIQAQHVKRLIDTIDDNQKYAVIVDEEIDKDFAGLVANTLAEKKQIPVMLLSPSKTGKIYNGSFRSINGFPLKETIKNIYGVSFVAGHEFAGGVGIYAKSLNAFKAMLDKKLADVTFDGVITYDMELDVNEITERMCEDVMKFTRICGKEMPEARFKIVGLFTEDKDLMGSKLDTIKIDCDSMKLMKFRSDEDFYNEVPILKDLEAVGTMNLNKFFNGGTRKFIVTKQLFLDEYRITG